MKVLGHAFREEGPATKLVGIGKCRRYVRSTYAVDFWDIGVEVFW